MDVRPVLSTTGTTPVRAVLVMLQTFSIAAQAFSRFSPLFTL
jgi:hypothetical protein